MWPSSITIDGIVMLILKFKIVSIISFYQAMEMSNLEMEIAIMGLLKMDLWTAKDYTDGKMDLLMKVSLTVIVLQDKVN